MVLRQAQHSDTATLCALSSIHENELLRLLVSRRSDREIAEAFYITRRTVHGSASEASTCALGGGVMGLRRRRHSRSYASARALGRSPDEGCDPRARTHGGCSGAELCGSGIRRRLIEIADDHQVSAREEVGGQLTADASGQRRAAAGTENTMPLILEAVRHYATLGEISRAMGDVFGGWTERPVI